MLHLYFHYLIFVNECKISILCIFCLFILSSNRHKLLLHSLTSPSRALFPISVAWGRNEGASLLAALTDPILNVASLFSYRKNGFIVSVMVKISVSKVYPYFVILFGFRFLGTYFFWSSLALQTDAIYLML